MTTCLGISVKNFRSFKKFGLAFATAALVVMGLTIYPLVSLAAGTSSSGGSNYSIPAVSKDMREAVVMINKENYPKALMLLEREISKDPKNADAWNLTGYASRKMGDYVASEKAYDRALSINPKHKGALEYKGELYLTLDNLKGAEDMFDRLNQVCPFGCKEKKQLAAAIKTYKKAS